jgi:hypothetical protein
VHACCAHAAEDDYVLLTTLQMRGNTVIRPV